MLKKGDKYVVYTKYGGVNKGVVASTYFVTVYDTINGVCYRENHIVNTNGIHYNLNEEKIFKVSKLLSKKQIETLNKLEELIIKRKQ